MSQSPILDELARFYLKLISPPRPSMAQLELKLQIYPFQQSIIDKTPFNIGRDSTNHLVIDDPTIDRFHARILQQGEQYLLVDLNSTSGTRIGIIHLLPDQPIPLFHDNIIKLGAIGVDVHIRKPLQPEVTAHKLNNHDQPHQLTEVSPSRQSSPIISSSSSYENLKPQISSSSPRIDVLNLRRKVYPLLGAPLLDQISLSILPGEFVVVAGVSGGGKSTLMNALSGQRRAGGQVLINGKNLYRHLDQFKSQIGYVPQDDIVHVELTVQEALFYSARLRMPQWSRSQRQQQVHEVLEQLELTSRKNVPIYRLSGGQRKRVSLGVELITAPKLFFLDEATSGLDPGTELQMMTLLRRLSDRGCTVILITHATKNVALADQVIFLAKGGRLAYFGSPQSALQHFLVAEFDEIYSTVEKQPPQIWQERYRQSSAHQSYVSDRQRTIPSDATVSVSTQPNLLEQWLVLCDRNLNILRKNRVSLILTVTVIPILGGLNLLLWDAALFQNDGGNPGQAITMLFVLVIMAVMSGTLATMTEIAKETTIYRRERSAGLGILPYVGSKLHLAFLLALYQSGGLAISAVFSVHGFHGKIAIVGMYLTLFLTSFSSMILGLLISAISPTQSVAPLLTILLIIPQIVFGGGMLPVSEFNPTSRSINQFMLTKYPFESLVTLSKLGQDVADDSCWQKSSDEREQLTAEQIKSCKCYGTSVFSQCNFPGVANLERSANPQLDLFQARSFIEVSYQSYGTMFKVNLILHSAKMVVLIGGLTTLLFFVQRLKG
jgi:ABC-type multidrug transport system ATPase subunit